MASVVAGSALVAGRASVVVVLGFEVRKGFDPYADYNTSLFVFFQAEDAFGRFVDLVWEAFGKFPNQTVDGFGVEGFVFFELVAQVDPAHAVGMLGEELEDAVVDFGGDCHMPRYLTCAYCRPCTTSGSSRR